MGGIAFYRSSPKNPSEALYTGQLGKHEALQCLVWQEADQNPMGMAFASLEKVS